MSLLGNRSPFGHRLVGSDGTALAFSAATLTALKAIVATDRTHGMDVRVDTDGKIYRWHSTSTVTGDDYLVVTPTDAPSAGRWLLVPGAVDLSFAIAFGTADAAVLYTFPTGARFQFANGYYRVTADWTGGSSSSIGLSSGKTGFSTKGDLIGATLAAALVASANIVPGTIGTGVDTVAKLKTALFVAGDTLRHDRIVSAYTAGTGFVHVNGILVRNDGI